MVRPKSDSEVRTDLPKGPYQFILIQPGITANYSGSRMLLVESEIFDQTMDFQDLTHVGSGWWMNHEEPVERSHRCEPHFQPCGGFLVFDYLSTKAVKALPVEYGTQNYAILSCSNPECGMRLGIKVTEAELKNLIFHLMIKQLVTNLKFCHYLNCSDIPRLGQEGVISLSSEKVLYGKHEKFFSVSEFNSFFLAFRLFAGDNTLEGFCGLDHLVSFLFGKKMEQIKQATHDQIGSILGPKQLKPRKQY